MQDTESEGQKYKNNFNVHAAKLEDWYCHSVLNLDICY
jgi:hypothetical protein